MLDAERCRRILSEGFPGLEVRTVSYFAQGWDYELWEVNDDLLFRFPLRPEAAEPLRKEARLLGELAATLSVPVPQPEYVSDGCAAFPLPFFGYRKLNGLPLDQATLSGQQRETLARQLAWFLSELHRFPPTRAAELGVPVYSADGWREHYHDFREEVRRQVLPMLSDEERAAVEAFWRRFLDDERHFRFRPVLIHADLGLEHILIDPERTQVTGVIDFADARVGDPALDFTGFDVALREKVLAHYELPVDETLLFRAHWYWQVGPFYEVIYGLQIRKQEHVEAGLEGIRQRIVNDK